MKIRDREQPSRVRAIPIAIDKAKMKTSFVKEVQNNREIKKGSSKIKIENNIKTELKSDLQANLK